MATTAQWGAFQWGEAEWGSIDEGADQATGSFGMDGSGALTGFTEGVAAGTFDLNGSGVPTTSITGIGVGTLEMNGAAIGQRARFVHRLLTCGEPLTTFCQDWLLGNDDPRRNG